MSILPYNRQAAIAYAHKWAFGRNPKYGDFSEMGGDCSNFISQCLVGGGAVMNETKDIGWFYHSMHSRAAGWTAVPYLYKFLVNNRGRGPFAHEIPPGETEPGDIVQLKFAGKEDYSHSLLVVSAAPLRVACHSFDSDNRPLDTYSYVSARGIHIDGVRG